MIVDSLTELKERLTPGSRLLGLDLGSKTVGLALSDAALIVATPRQTLRRGKFTQDAEILRRLIEELDVGALVIGLPLSMDGSEGPRCHSTRDFAANLMKAFAETPQASIPICFHDERLSTAAVERMLITEADMTRKRRAQVIDKAAAAYILQGALDIIKGAG